MNKLFFAILCLSGMVRAQTIIKEPFAILPGHSNDILQVTQTAKGELIATSSWDKNIVVYDSAYKLKRTLSGHTFPVTALRFRPDGKLLASGASDNNIIIWDSMWRNSQTLSGHTNKINALLFDRSLKYLFSGSDDRKIMAWDVKTGKSFRTIDFGFAVHSFAQSSDPRFLAVAGANPQIRVYNLTNNQLAKTFVGHSDMVNAIAISNNNKFLLSGSNDKTARIWDMVTNKQLRVLPVDCWKVTAVAFTDDSKYCVTGNDGSLKIWEVETGKLLARIEANGQYVKDLAFSKNKTKIYAACLLKGTTDYGLRVWPSGIELPKPSAPTPLKTDSVSTLPDSLKTKTTAKPAVPLPVKK
jgi:WD40 repeat protein